MGSAHYFVVNDCRLFVANLEARHYMAEKAGGQDERWVVYSKIKSGALIKHYRLPARIPQNNAIAVRVTYTLVDRGLPLRRLASELKKLNTEYRKSLPGW